MLEQLLDLEVSMKDIIDVELVEESTGNYAPGSSSITGGLCCGD